MREGVRYGTEVCALLGANTEAYKRRFDKCIQLTNCAGIEPTFRFGQRRERGDKESPHNRIGYFGEARRPITKPIDFPSNQPADLCVLP